MGKYGEKWRGLTDKSAKRWGDVGRGVGPYLLTGSREFCKFKKKKVEKIR